MHMDEHFDLIEDELGRLVLKRPGAPDVEDVRVVRSFPLSSPDRNISVRSSEGKELLLVPDLTKLESHQRALIEKWLDRTSFIPKILKVEEVDDRFGYQQWKVQTDRGPASFRVQEREDIRFLPDGRFRLKDADGNVYDLPSHAELDPASSRAIVSLV
jgi:hypothetical protein